MNIDTHDNLDGLKGIMLNGKKKPQKATYCMIPFVLHSQDDNYRDSCQGLREEKKAVTVKQWGEFLRGDERDLYFDYNNGYSVLHVLVPLGCSNKIPLIG